PRSLSQLCRSNDQWLISKQRTTTNRSSHLLAQQGLQQLMQGTSWWNEERRSV
ncbi:unnamed protein product, partial [Closterium sp. Naga37s-1]